MVQVDIGVGQDELQVILLFSPLLSRKPPPPHPLRLQHHISDQNIRRMGWLRSPARGG